MNEEKAQVSLSEYQDTASGELSNDDLAATLGFMTTLGEQNLMAQQPQEGSDAEESAPEEEIPETTPEPAPTEESGVLSEIKAIRAEIEQQDVSKEVAEIRAELEKLLEEEKSDNGTETENKDTAE